MEANLIALRILKLSSFILYLGLPTVFIILLSISPLALSKSIRLPSLSLTGNVIQGTLFFLPGGTKFASNPTSYFSIQALY